MAKIAPSLSLNFALLTQLVLNRFKCLLIALDTGDPDNAVLLLAARTWFPNLPIYVLVTGRPVNLNANDDTKKFEWNLAHSIAAQQDGAWRYKNLLEECGLNPVIFFDGGIACNAQVPPKDALPDHYKFEDMQDHLQSRFYPTLHETSELIELLLGYEDKSIAVLVGGPLTGLARVIQQAGNMDAWGVVEKFAVIHAQLGTFGGVPMAEFDPKLARGLKTFNAALDPVSSYYFLNSVSCPIYLVTTDAAKDDRIAYATTAILRKFLGNSRAARKICEQYKTWEREVLKKLKSKIFVYDFGVLISLCESMLPERLVFDMQPVNVEKIYHLATSAEDVKKWGTIDLTFANSETGVWAAQTLVEGGYERYHNALWQVFQSKEITQKPLV